MVMRLGEADHERVSAAIAAAEGSTAGEIVAVVTDCSDPYHDVALHWAVLVLIAVLAWAAACPSCLEWWRDILLGGWRGEPSLRELLTFLMILAVAKFTAVLLILKYMPLRLVLTPGATKTRRVRRRALGVFKAAAERRTVGRTGILIYLSMGEHRAEIIGDEAITSVTTPETWGEAMAALLTEVRQGRVADGMVAAIERIGAVLSEHFPRAPEDRNEIPDKLIEL
jgi:putative membrane protein